MSVCPTTEVKYAVHPASQGWNDRYSVSTHGCARTGTGELWCWSLTGRERLAQHPGQAVRVVLRVAVLGRITRRLRGVPVAAGLLVRQAQVLVRVVALQLDLGSL